MKKIAILIHGLGADGIDTLFANLSAYWDLSTYDITYFLAVDPGPKQFWEDKVLQNRVRVIHITDLDGKKLYFWPKNLAKALREFGPFDVIHVNMDMLNGINLRVAKKLKIHQRICHAHNSSNQQMHSPIKAAIKAVYLFVMKRWMKRYSTQKIACSGQAGDYFFGKNNYDTIFNGIDVKKFKNKSVGCPKNDKIKICTVGRIVDQKNPIFIADVINELYLLNNNIEFLWIGTGGMDKEVHEYVKSIPANNVIKFLGVRDDVENVLSECSYFLFPSKYEGFGLVAVEAQAAGLDCFVSDAVPKDIDCGKCKFISLEKTPAMWAEEIMAYIRSNQEMKLDDDKLNRFDIRYMAEELQDLYSKE